MSTFNSLIELIKEIPANFQPATITACATLLGALIGATIAQYISHRFTNKREKDKYFKEVYQKLFASVFLDIYAYLDISTHFRRRNDIKYNVNENDLLIKVLKSIENNLMYASPKLITYFNNVKKNQYQNDFSDFRYRIDELNLFTVFLEELYTKSRKMKLLDSRSKKELVKYMVLYKVWIIYSEYYQNFEEASLLLRYKFYFENKNINYRRYKLLKKYYDRSIFRNRLDFFIKNIKELFEKSEYLVSKQITKILNQVLENINPYARYQNLNKAFDIIKVNKVERKDILTQRDSIYKCTNNYYRRDDSPFTKRLFFFEINLTFEKGKLILNLEVRNISEDIEDINIDNFILLKFGEMRVNIDEKNSGIYNKVQYSIKTYKLLPTEVIKLRIIFYIEHINCDGYKLIYISEGRTYKLHEIGKRRN
ncbi:hypothetical protein [Clostridium sp. YIM B02551]|uniref:hypothetical protein n=1 Tax=Clostridium sp. YIM B02551 TaxID=2910679 RepID=UPI001EEB654E|nr:hypothetical protein [Clostridium sp. YIM B02551]